MSNGTIQMQPSFTHTMQEEIARLRRVIVAKDSEIIRLTNIINFRAIEHDITPMSIECVMHHVCVFYNMTVNMLVERNRKGERVKARMAACWICNRRYKHTFKSIGCKMAHRDHSTIMNACAEADNFIKTNIAFKHQVDMIIKSIENDFIQPHNES